MKRWVLAFALTMIALGVPCAAWYIVGCRETWRRVAEIESSPRQLAHETATQLADRLRDRLETLRTTESRRPYYHYQSLYHDPKGASEGASVVPSPLAEGPSDPLVLGYFQLDSAGQLTMPTLDEQTDTQRVLQQQLAPAVPASACVAALRQTPQKVEVLQPDVYSQNVQAGQIYKNIKSNVGNTLTNFSRQVSIGVGQFSWCTITIGGVVSPVALREVRTPEGRLVQGFVVSVPAVAESLKGAALPARFVPESPGRDSVSVPVESLNWHVAVDIVNAVAEAHSRAQETRAHFARVFSFGAVAAAVAGLCVVWLVWQTERLARQRSQFAASAAHELRTPLAGLRLYSDMLAEGLGDPGKTKDYSQRVAAEAERLGRVVANVLGFTRLERGTLNVQPVTGDLAAVVRECVSRQQPALEAAGVRVECGLPEGLPAVKFDRDAVAQILQNLLDNAEKHTRHAADRTVRVALAARDCVVALSVRDRGPGIPGEVRRHLFEAFRRGADNDAPAGLGLGLVLVKALAEAQGARVSYVDTNGGAEFVVTFPA